MRRRGSTRADSCHFVVTRCASGSHSGIPSMLYAAYNMNALASDRDHGTSPRAGLVPAKVNPKMKQTTSRERSYSVTALREALEPYRDSDTEATFWQERRCIFIGITLASIVLLAAIVAAVLSLSAGTRKANYTVCRTVPCRNYAAMLRASMDPKRDPCEDFYSYVCDDWDRKEPTSVYWKQVRVFAREMTAGLEATVNRLNQSATDKVAIFFQSCRKAVTDTGRGELDILRKIWQDCDIYWPAPSKNADVLKTAIRLYKAFEMENILNIVKYDHSGGPRPYIYMGSEVAAYYKVSLFIKSAGGYQKYYEDYQRLLKPQTATEEDLLPYHRLLEIEDFIYNQLMSDRNFPIDLTILNTSQLQELTPHIPSQRWADAFRSELDVPRDVLVEVNNQHFMRAINRVFERVGEVEIHRYLGWFNIQQMAAFVNPSLLLVYSGSEYQAHHNALYGCLYKTEYFMGWATYANYAARSLAGDVRKDLHEIFRKIGNVALVKANNGAWNPENQPQAASYFQLWRQQLLKYADRFPTPEDIDTVFTNVSNMGGHVLINWVTLVRGRSETNTGTLDSVFTSFVDQIMKRPFYNFWNLELNAFLIPPYVAVLPLYEFGISRPVKYGGLGVLTAETAVSRLRSYYPSLLQKTWSCFNESFDGGAYDRWILDTALSLDIAWDAYNSIRAGGDIRLHSLRSISEEQVFFIAACYLLCGQWERNLFVRKCNEPLKHSARFSEAFSCHKKSPMNSRNKCDFFKP